MIEELNLCEEYQKDPTVIGSHPKDTKNLRYIGKLNIINSVCSEDGTLVIDHEGAKRAARFSYFMDLYETPYWVRVFESDLGYVVHGDIYMDFVSNPTIQRLNRIKQLGIVVTGPQFSSASQSRFSHSLVTTVLMEVVLTKNGFSEHDINLGIVSGLYHDLAMPAYSDQGKLANRDELDEEKNFPLVLNKIEGIDDLLAEYGLNREELIACVRGEYPVVGEILNSNNIDLDKISYILTDVNTCFHFFDNVPFKDLTHFLSKEPTLFDVYQDTTITDGTVYFSNPDRLRAFLFSRALMFKNVYFSDRNRAREAFLERELTKLWGEGILTKDLLLETSDELICNILEKHIPNELFKYWFWTLFGVPFEEVKRFYNSSFKEVKAEFGNDFIVKQQKSFNPCLETRILVAGKVLPFRQVFPEEAAEIQKIADSCAYIGVYAMNL